MKKYLISFFVLCVCGIASAANIVVIDLTCLQGQTLVNFEVDWSQLTIKRLSIEDWLASRQAELLEYDALEELENQCKPQVVELVKKVNKKLEKSALALAKKEGCKYTLRIIPIDIDSKGNNEIQCIVVENESQKIIADFIVKGKGGHWGQLPNLWGDGFRHAGAALGDVISRAIKQKIAYTRK